VKASRSESRWAQRRTSKPMSYHW